MSGDCLGLGVVSDSDARTPLSALDDCATHASALTNCPSEVLRTALREREDLGSTRIAPGIHLPHAVLPNLGRSCLVLVRPRDPQPDLRLLIALFVDQGATEPVLGAVRRLSRALADDELLEELATAPAHRCVERLKPLMTHP
ncbi:MULTISPECIES: PTS sugar transporter subunit IIA [unclassified Luteococcus]|uniref:PTS sugar transporter subunit IIA n=1 Tax=unclassified Luteococcus TaxID=2639923 RepID=UPI00313DB14A